MDPAALQVLHHVLDARKQGGTDTVSLPGADLRGAQLLRADLVGANLAGVGLDHAQLAGAKLGKANLSAAMLSHADLAGADLAEADLRNADLSFARIEGASLAGADLRGAAIEGVIGEPSTIVGARIDRAMADRSAINDSDIIQLWRAGAIIEDLDEFDSVIVQQAVEVPELPSEVGPSDRDVSDMEATALFERAKLDEAMPPSARVSVEILRSIEESAPMSMRSLQLVADVITPELRMAPSWKKGDTVLGVELVEQVGDGNAGVVWRAHDIEGNVVAVKLFSTLRANIGLTLPSYRRGVAVMNRLTARLDDTDGVVDIRCVSLNKLGFVMDYASNGSVIDLPALRMGAKGVVKWFQKLCRIVSKAHEIGALHRCLKPSNILLDEDLQPLLTDFDMVDLPTLASEAVAAGGYASYAAPEELLGQGTQSPTADVYSLGRVLYYLLLEEEPSHKSELTPKLDDLDDQPQGLVRIIRKCTMRAPEARYQWVSDLIADLENYKDIENVGIASGPEANYLPHNVSSLSHKTTWLSGKRESEKREPGRPTRRRRSRKDKAALDERSATGLSSSTEMLLGAVGTLMLLASILLVEFASSTPDQDQLLRLRIVSVIGGALMTFLIRQGDSNARLWRLMWIAVALIGFYMLNLPAWFV